MMAAAALTLAVMTAPASAVPGKAPLGGGSGIAIVQADGSAALCTLTTIGHDQRGGLVGLTAGHCGDRGASVLSESWPLRGPVGVVDHVNSELDYALIRFDAAAVQPRSTVDGVTIRSVQMTPPHFPDIACKSGRTSGHTCGIVWISGHKVHISQMCVIEGDSGSPVVLGDRLIGMVNAYYEVACLGPEKGTNIGPVMRDLQDHGVTGFRLA